MKRPYATHYFKSDRLLSARGACATPKGAIRATVVHIFLGEYDKAVVYDRRTGAAIYTVMLRGRRLEVLYGGR